MSLPKPKLPIQEMQAMWPVGSEVFWKPGESRSKLRYGTMVRGCVVGYQPKVSLVTIRIISGRHLGVHPHSLEAR